MEIEYRGDRISAKEAAAMLCMNAQSLRIMLQRGELQEVGKAVPPKEGYTQYRYLIFRDNVLAFMGKGKKVIAEE